MAKTAPAMDTISEALAMREVEAGLFKTNIHPHYCYGEWAWGGLIASLFQAAAANFVANGHADAQRPHVLNVQIQYLRPVLSKEVEIRVRATHQTKTFSTLHVALSQRGKECNVGYVNLTNLGVPIGLTFDTKWGLHPPPPPANLDELQANTSADWIRYTTPFTEKGWFRLQSLVKFWFPYQQQSSSIADQWMTPTDPRNAFTNESLGMIADLWAPFIENFDDKAANRHEQLIDVAREQKSNPDGQSALMDAKVRKGWVSRFIMMTLAQSLEIKKLLPPEGVKWLFVRAYAKAIEKGKFDAEILIMNENMELVALSHQIVLVAKWRPEVRDKTNFESKKAKI